MPYRYTLTFKLIVAFLAVGLLGVSIVALVVGARTYDEFERFVRQRRHEDYFDRHSVDEWEALWNRWEQDSPEAAFEKGVFKALVIGAWAAAAAALLFGVFLARTLSRPIRELTEAMQVMAQGALGHQVRVRSKDELGRLAHSFNQMSLDLAQANQARRQMTADIAHDLRTPLSIIAGYTEAFNDGKLSGSPDMYAVIHSQVQHLAHLIDDLRTLSLADAGELPLNRRPVDPGALLERTTLAYVAQAETQAVTLNIEAASNLPVVTVDVERMTQVLGNLVSNALRYTPAGGQIVLAAIPNGVGVHLNVRDTGRGIAPADLPFIFDRFYRANKARQRSEGESGLGLAIAKSIVTAHGGDITVESRLDHGTTFSIVLNHGG